MSPDVTDLLPLATHAMGTRFELVLPRSGCSEPALRAAGEAALREVERWHDRLSRFSPSSDISRLNRLRAGRVDPELAHLFQLAEQVNRDSNGAFDLAAASRGRAAPSSPLDQPAFTLDPDGPTIRLAPWAMLDLGAIGKGWALDRAGDLLRDAGITSALLHGGTSSVLAVGHPPDHAGWRIVIRSDAQPLPITLADAALGVTAARGHRDPAAPDPDPRADGSREHLFDPATGVPIRSGSIDTAAVIGPSAALCDAWSTALAVLAMRGQSPSAAPRLPPAYESHLHGPGGWTSAIPSRH